MRVLLFVLAALAVLAGTGILSAANSAVHEIEAFILFLIGAVLLSGAGVIEILLTVRRELMLVRAALETKQ